jgi:hypothetical protein
MDLICLAQYRGRWWVLFNVVMNRWLPQNAHDFFVG